MEHWAGMRATFATVVILACVPCPATAQESQPQGAAAREDKQTAEAMKLIEQLVFDHPKASDPIVYSPRDEHGQEYKRRFEKCQQAFRKLTELGEAAFPVLVAHLDDKRPSIHFRNHYMGHSVGNACYWNIYFQLSDHPRDYSSYGYSRKGRDGKDHPKPYWEGTPFGGAGGVKAWLEENRALSYREKQIKCLAWLLDREKAIGAPDAESYFENILPLEIRILERRLQKGDEVKEELARLRRILKDKLAKEIPAGVLPEKASEEK
jgi:hypothetical protein